MARTGPVIIFLASSLATLSCATANFVRVLLPPNPPSSAAPVAPATVGHLTRFPLTRLKSMLLILGRGHFGGQQRTFPGLELWRSIFLSRPADRSHPSLAAVPSPAAHHVGSARFLLNLVVLWSFQSGFQCSPRLVGLSHSSQKCRGHHNRVIHIRKFLRLNNPYRTYPCFQQLLKIRQNPSATLPRQKAVQFYHIWTTDALR